MYSREPGGTVLSENIRSLLLNPKNNISALAELILYEASRAQHMEEVIIPALKSGKIAVCDRFTDSTIAYQGFGRGIDLRIIKRLNSIATQGIEPDLTLILDIDAEKGLNKAKGLKKGYKHGDRIERENLEFHRKVRKGFLYAARTMPARVRLIKTRQSLEDTRDEINLIAEKFLKRKGCL